MIKIHKKKNDVSIDTVINTVWVSTFLAILLTVPSLGIFLGIYFSTENIILGAVLGFGTHFVIFAFSEKISKALIRMMN